MNHERALYVGCCNRGNAWSQALHVHTMTRRPDDALMVCRVVPSLTWRPLMPPLSSVTHHCLMQRGSLELSPKCKRGRCMHRGLGCFPVRHLIFQGTCGWAAIGTAKAFLVILSFSCPCGTAAARKPRFSCGFYSRHPSHVVIGFRRTASPNLEIDSVVCHLRYVFRMFRGGYSF